MVDSHPARGNIWMMDFNPILGHEQGGLRPALIISADRMNEGHSGLVIVIPLTSKRKMIISHIPISPPEGGVRKHCFIKCEDVRSVSTERLIKCIGIITPKTMQKVENCLRILMDL